MEIRKRCPHCDYENIFDEETLLKKAEIYKAVKPSLHKRPRVVTKKCKSCAAMLKIEI